MPDEPEHHNTRFTKPLREKYLRLIETGSGKMKAAEMCGISYRTVVRRRRSDPEFVELEEYAFNRQLERVEDMVFELALAGDLTAAKMILTAHNRAYRPNTQVTIDATPAAVEMTQNQALAEIAKMKGDLRERRLELEADGDRPPVIDVGSVEHTPAVVEADA